MKLWPKLETRADSLTESLVSLLQSQAAGSVTASVDAREW